MLVVVRQRRDALAMWGSSWARSAVVGAMLVVALCATADIAYGFTAPVLGIGKQGNTVFVWQSFHETVPPSAVIQARWRAVNGTLKPPETLSTDSQAPSRPKVAVADDGTATMVWTISDGTIAFIQAMRRAPDGTAGPKMTLSAVGSDAEEPQVAADSAGNATFVWKQFNGKNWVIEARRMDSLPRRERALPL